MFAIVAGKGKTAGAKVVFHRRTVHPLALPADDTRTSGIFFTKLGDTKIPAHKWTVTTIPSISLDRYLPPYMPNTLPLLEIEKIHPYFDDRGNKGHDWAEFLINVLKLNKEGYYPLEHGGPACHIPLAKRRYTFSVMPEMSFGGDRGDEGNGLNAEVSSMFTATLKKFYGFNFENLPFINCCFSKFRRCIVSYVSDFGLLVSGCDLCEYVKPRNLHSSFVWVERMTAKYLTTISSPWVCCLSGSVRSPERHTSISDYSSLSHLHISSSQDLVQLSAYSGATFARYCTVVPQLIRAYFNLLPCYTTLVQITDFSNSLTYRFKAGPT